MDYITQNNSCSNCYYSKHSEDTEYYGDNHCYCTINNDLIDDDNYCENYFNSDAR